MTATTEIIQRLEKAKEPIQAYLDMNYTSVEAVRTEQTNQPNIRASNVSNHFEPILIKQKGNIYRSIFHGSHYRDPITSNENYGGRSRIWADSDLEVQERIIEDTVQLMKSGPFVRNSPNVRYNRKIETFNDRFISLCIAIMRIECGFNLDAAAGTTSAASLGQFIKDTGIKYGIDKNNLWEFNVNIRALINHTLDNRNDANAKKQGEEYIYALHHDGPKLSHGGLDLSKKEVMPWVPKIQSLVETYKG